VTRREGNSRCDWKDSAGLLEVVHALLHLPERGEKKTLSSPKTRESARNYGEANHYSQFTGFGGRREDRNLA